MAKELLTPGYIFEASWEVCNKVGGHLYSVVNKGKNTARYLKDKVFFYRPGCVGRKREPLVYRE